jgi:hypothetical protein
LQVEAAKASRTVRHGDIERDDWLPGAARLRRTADPLRASLFRDTTTAEQQAGAAETGYLEVFPDKGQYVLRDRAGRCPSAGDRVEGEDGVGYVVLKVGRSPLPNDGRRCVYLELSRGVNRADEPPPQR